MIADWCLVTWPPLPEKLGRDAGWAGGAACPTLLLRNNLALRSLAVAARCVVSWPPLPEKLGRDAGWAGGAACPTLLLRNNLPPLPCGRGPVRLRPPLPERVVGMPDGQAAPPAPPCCCVITCLRSLAVAPRCVVSWPPLPEKLGRDAGWAGGGACPTLLLRNNLPPLPCGRGPVRSWVAMPDGQAAPPVPPCCCVITCLRSLAVAAGAVSWPPLPEKLGRDAGWAGGAACPTLLLRNNLALRSLRSRPGAW